MAVLGLLLLPGMLEEVVADLMMALADECEAMIEVGAAVVAVAVVVL